jgi:hypothetical protein
MSEDDVGIDVGEHLVLRGLLGVEDGGAAAEGLDVTFVLGELIDELRKREPRTDASVSPDEERQ